jgi:hypothetical protein
MHVNEASREYRRTVKPLGSGFEMYFAHEPLPKDAPVYVFQHTTKTAGTSVRAVVYHNCAAGLRFEIRPDLPTKYTRNLAAIYRDLHDTLTQDDRARLVWAASHSAAFFIPYVDRPVRGITVVREPLDRALSRFWFGEKVRQRTMEMLEEQQRELMADMGGREGMEWKVAEYSNPQSRWLLGPFCDVRELPIVPRSDTDTSLWRAKLVAHLDETYHLLLLQNRLEESIEKLARTCGWTITSVPHLRRNRERPASEDVPASLRERIYAANWLDVELFRYASTRFESGYP